MAQILKNFVDSTKAVRPECFMVAAACRSKALFDGIHIILLFYHDIASYKTGDQPIMKKDFIIPRTSKVYQDYFNSELRDQKSDIILTYDFLKMLDGTMQTLTFYKTEQRQREMPLAEDEEPVIKENGLPVTQWETFDEQVVDLMLDSMLGINLSAPIPSVTMAELQAKEIDGLPNGSPAYVEDTNTIWTIQEGVYTNSGLTISQFSA